MTKESRLSLIAKIARKFPVARIAAVYNPTVHDTREEISLAVPKDSEDDEAMTSQLNFDKAKAKISESDFLLSSKERKLLRREIAMTHANVSV